MKLKLLIETGEHQGLIFSTSQLGIYRLGRLAKADIALTGDQYVSREHCIIELSPTGAIIRDTSSRSGTFVNTERITEAQLGDGDTLLIGQTTLRVSLTGVSAPAKTVERPGQVAGFTLVRKLPVDGPGEVWWAMAEAAAELVTLYFLPLDGPTAAEDRRRFMRQAAVCARLHHPGLAEFLTQDITPDTLWFATEISQGKNLKKIVTRQGPLPLDEALDVMHQTLDIVVYLHQEDVVHRSLRPESLLIEREASKLVVKLTDLGSAKCFQTAELQRITKLGERGYLIHPFTAPEALLDFAKMDPRSDIYSLGAIFYFALTGHIPYEAETELALTTAILEQDPPALATLKPDVPATLVEVVDRAMARELGQRYNTALEMHEALRQAAKPSHLYQLTSFSKNDETASSFAVTPPYRAKPATPTKIFISYSHQDEGEKDQLLTHLGVLQRAGLIELWSDDRINVGADWEAEIRQAIEQASVAILFITAHFLTSDFILGQEVPALFKRRERQGLTIFPVIAKACAWRTVDWLAQLNVRPKNGLPIWSGSGSQVNDALATIAEEVAIIIR